MHSLRIAQKHGCASLSHLARSIVAVAAGRRLKGEFLTLANGIALQPLMLHVYWNKTIWNWWLRHKRARAHTHKIGILFSDICDFPIFLSQLFIIPDLYFNGARIETVSSSISSNNIPRVIRTRRLVVRLYVVYIIMERYWNGEMFNSGILFCDVWRSLILGRERI